MNIRFKTKVWIALAACAAGSLAAQTTESDVAALREEMQALKMKVEQLESELVASTGIEVGEAGDVDDRLTLNDRQEAAARLDNLSIDPKYRGFIRIPNTDVIMKLNAKPRVDMTSDSKNSGNKYRFITAKIPVGKEPSRGGGEQFNINANGSQIRWDVRAPDVPGSPRFYYQNDFFGESDADMKYRLQHLYGCIYNVVVGFTYGVFENPDVWPDTVDYEGPNAVNFARRALVHYKQPISDHWSVTFGVEKPDIYVEPANPGDTADTPMPDIGANLRWDNADKGHMQLSTIARYIGVNSVVNRDDHVMGWGFNFGGSYNVTPDDTLLGLVNLGKGIGGMGNDTGFVDSDAAYDAGGNLEALPYYSIMLALTHEWNPRWRSTVSYGYVNIDNTDGQVGGAYHDTTYGSANVICQVRKQMSIGLEGLYGEKETNDGASGDVFRLQLGFVYSIF